MELTSTFRARASRLAVVIRMVASGLVSSQLRCVRLTLALKANSFWVRPQDNLRYLSSPGRNCSTVPTLTRHLAGRQG